MTTEEPSRSQSPARRERLLLLCLMAAACLTLAHFVHEAWFGYESAVVSGRIALPAQNVRYAPDAYRVAMPLVVPALQHAFHLASPSIIGAAQDFLFGFGALFLLYLLVVEGFSSQPQRFAAAISFLALVQFPFAWVVPHQRPETMPTAFYVALALYAASRRTRIGFWTAVLLVATLLQSFLRTDVPFVLGIALALVALRRPPSGSRSLSLSQGLAVAALAGAIQWYLQAVLFPHLSYPPDTQVFQLLNNLQRHSLSAALLAIIPCLLPLLLRSGQRLRPLDTLALAGSALYLPLWFSVGVAAEVRIFVPFLLAVCMVSARSMAQAFAPVTENEREKGI